MRKCWKPLALRKALRSLPSSLDETYESVIARIDEQHVEDAVSILKCMVSSFRPLQLQELAEIIAIDWEDNGNFEPSYRMPDIRAIRSICSGLLTTASSADATSVEVELQLAHSSVRDFLVSERRRNTVQSPFAFDEWNAHTFLAKACLAYLLNVTKVSKSAPKLKEEFPLAEYAALYWVDHYRLASGKIDLQHFANTLFDKKRRYHLISWCHLHDIDKPWRSHNIHQSPVESASALYYASLAGLDMIVEALLESGEEPNQRGGVFGFPLQAAAYEGHLSIVRHLLNAGDKPDLCGGQTGYPIMAAASRGHVDVVRLLLKYGAFYDVQVFSGGTPLLQAAGNGHEEVVHVLLEAGSEPNLIVGKRGSALTAAAARGHESICRLLLEHGPKASENEGLIHYDAQAAAVGGYGNVVNLLLSHGAKPTATLLASAAKGRLLDVVDKLLVQGSPAKGGKYARPLTGAAAGGSVSVVCQLLFHGADVNNHDQHRGTALQAAAAASHESVVKALTDRGALTDIAGDFWAPALHSAAYCGHPSVVQILLDHVPPADVNAPGTRRSNGQYFGSVLHNAAFSGNLATVKLVFQSGGRINERSGTYGSPLQAAAVSDNVLVVEYLLENDADVNASGGKHGTALEAAAHTGNCKMIERLLEHGADVNLRGSTGFPGSEDSWIRDSPTKGPLRAAAKEGHAVIVSQLLGAGAYPESPFSPRTSDLSEDVSPLEQAVIAGHSAVVQIFLQHGLDPNKVFPAMSGRARQYSSTEGRADEAFPIRQTGRSGDIATMKALVEAGGDVNMASSDGWTALHEAAMAGHYQLTLALLDDYSADMNMQLVNGSRAIHLAAQEGNDTCVRIFLDRGMDINVKNLDGSTPLHTAAENGRMEVVKTLIAQGGDAGLVDQKAGLTALELAEFKLAKREDGHRGKSNPDLERLVEFGRRLYGWE